jgi:hypothetical protein
MTGNGFNSNLKVNGATVNLDGSTGVAYLENFLLLIAPPPPFLNMKLCKERITRLRIMG